MSRPGALDTLYKMSKNEDIPNDVRVELLLLRIDVQKLIDAAHALPKAPNDILDTLSPEGADHYARLSMRDLTAKNIRDLNDALDHCLGLK